MKNTREDYIVDTINYILLAIVGFVTLYPFYYIVVCSFNDGVDLMRGGVYLWPRKFSLASYKQFIEDSSWINAFFMSVARTVAGTLFSVTITCIFSYGLSRKNLCSEEYI